MVVTRNSYCNKLNVCINNKKKNFTLQNINKIRNLNKFLLKNNLVKIVKKDNKAEINLLFNSNKPKFKRIRFYRNVNKYTFK